jgi:hypothetical protein
MLFKLTETIYQVEIYRGTTVEMAMVDYFEKRGFSAIHHDFYLFHEAKKTKYPENEATLKKIIGESNLSQMREIGKKLYPSGVGPGLAPEQPDLFVYDDSGEYFFCEVKRKRTGDSLRPPQMIGISLIHTCLACPVEIAVVLNSQENPGFAPREYRWVWPCIQECGFADINLDKKKD